jgi:acetyl esterase/lipase
MYWLVIQQVFFLISIIFKSSNSSSYIYKGGHAAAKISQYLVKMNKPKPSIQLLIYPWTQMLSFTHPSFTYYHEKDFIANSKYPIGRYMSWLIGIKDDISEEMENIFISNNHTMLLNDKNLRKKYDSYLDINLIPEKYKNGKFYYEATRNEKSFSIYPPYKLDDLNVLFKNKELANKIKNQLLSEDSNPGLASSDILKQLPKTYFIIVEWDSLKDQGLIYAERLKLNGVSVKIAFYEEAFHGIVPFIHKVSGYNVARIMFEDAVSYINLNL